MESPEQFLARVKTTIGVPANQSNIQLHLTWHSLAEARLHIQHLRQMQKELRLIKKQIGLTIKSIRAQFSDKKTNVRSGLVTTLLVGKQIAARGRSLERQSLRRKETDAIAKYEKVNGIIDAALLEIDQTALEIKTWMTEHPSNESATPAPKMMNAEKPCPACGVINPPEFNFCGDCGTRL